MSVIPRPNLPARRPGPRADDFLQTITPPEDAADMARWLECALHLLGSGVRPGSVRQPQVPALLRIYAAHFRGVARAAEEWEASTAARAALLSRPVVGAAHTTPVSDAEELTTTQAAHLYGRSSEYWRLAAVAGRIPARKAPRNVWMLSRAAVADDS
jgi:hypothetical protein